MGKQQEAEMARKGNENLTTKEVSLKEGQTVTVKKKQKASISYTLKSMANNTMKLKEAGYLNETQHMQLNEIHQACAKAYMEKELGLM